MSRPPSSTSPSSSRASTPARDWLPTPLEWLYLAGGAGMVAFNFWLMDDAFVYYRYIDNLLLGNGLVYNQGEYVEGYSSPLWVLLLIALRATGLDYFAITVLLAVASFAIFALLVVKLNRRLSVDGPIVDAPLALLCLNYGVSAYFSSGAETPALQIAAVGFGLFFADANAKSARVAVALAPMIRPELVVPFALACLYERVRSGAIPWRMLALAGTTLGAWLAFRVVYYADLFPNTFYLKDVVLWQQGFHYLVDTFVTYHVPLLLAVFAAIAWTLHRRGAPFDLAARAMMLVCALVVTVYVVKIGGAPRHYRYLAFPFCLTLCAFAGLLERLLAELRLATPGRAAALGALAAVVGLAGHPRQLDRHPLLGEPEHTPVHGINEPIAAFYRGPKGPQMAEWARRANRDRMQPYLDGTPFEHTGTEASSKCREIYDRFETRFVHSYGLTDAILARTAMASDRPSHKHGLKPLAEDLVRLAREADRIGPGMYREAVAEGRAPAWIAANLATVELIEAKAYNRHDPIENLQLALTFPDPIDPTPGRAAPESPQRSALR